MTAQLHKQVLLMAELAKMVYGLRQQNKTTRQDEAELDASIAPAEAEVGAMAKVRIHNNNEGRGQHPELTGIALLDKVSQQLKHSPTSTPEHPSSWITGGCQSPLLEKYWRGRDLNPGLPFT